MHGCSLSNYCRFIVTIYIIIIENVYYVVKTFYYYQSLKM